MISLGELYASTGTQLLYDGNTGNVITIDTCREVGDREVMKIQGCKRKGEYGLDVWIGRRRASR